MRQLLQFVLVLLLLCTSSRQHLALLDCSRHYCHWLHPFLHHLDTEKLPPKFSVGAAFCNPISADGALP